MDERDDIAMLLTSMCCLLLINLPHSHSQSPPPPFNYSVCKEQSYNCGYLSARFYPFWGLNRLPQCGGGDAFQLTCDHDNTIIRIDSQNFTVKNIHNTAKTMIVVPTIDYLCSPQFLDTYLKMFRYQGYNNNITIFRDCPLIPNLPFGYNFTYCDISYIFELKDEELLSKFPALHDCQYRLNVTTGYPQLYLKDGVGELIDQLRGLKKGFEVNYDVPQNCTLCGGNDGPCPRDEIDEHVHSCYYYCPDALDALYCFPPKKLSIVAGVRDLSIRKIIFVVVGVMGGFMICIIICYRKCMSSTQQIKFWLPKNNDRDIEAFLKNHGALAQRRYKLSEVKKMTNSFKVKLGEGGFGAVYKGELLNGCAVAVKMLNASKGNCQDFINEVVSISRTSHVNIVTLLGFCLEGNKKALIYEFMHNGSLDKFIYNKGLEATSLLSWNNLWQIATGIARGLEYLHRGCNTRILHFDIKPHNILLDEKFCPKISDFGLAKLCPKNESIISMSGARGTIGYVAPEVWNKHFGGISHKSDVYSYGMMLLEMVGGRKNINTEASHTSEIYFPHWVYNKLEQGGDLRPDGVIAIEENEIARRMTIVGLWCVQTIPHNRPTMSKVIDMLEGNMNSLEMPPKPVLSSPARSVPGSSTS